MQEKKQLYVDKKPSNVDKNPANVDKKRLKKSDDHRKAINPPTLEEEAN